MLESNAILPMRIQRQKSRSPLRFQPNLDYLRCSTSNRSTPLTERDHILNHDVITGVGGGIFVDRPRVLLMIGISIGSAGLGSRFWYGFGFYYTRGSEQNDSCARVSWVKLNNNKNGNPNATAQRPYLLFCSRVSRRACGSSCSILLLGVVRIEIVMLLFLVSTWAEDERTRTRRVADGTYRRRRGVDVEQKRKKAWVASTFEQSRAE